MALQDLGATLVHLDAGALQMKNNVNKEAHQQDAFDIADDGWMYGKAA